MGTIALIFICYAIGSLSFAVLVSRACGLPDPRTYGSGNPGATNVMRTGKKTAAVLTLLGDGAKGWAAVFLAQHLAPSWGVSDAGIAACALATFLGHLFPMFFGFKGGKGVATTAGILLALNLWLGLAVLASWIVTFALTRISSLSALIAAILAPVYAWFFLSKVYVAMVLVLALLLILRHRANIKNLVQGKEGGFKKAQE
jgi:glycerol-3-phosphate acyltransferase PlsY